MINKILLSTTLMASILASVSLANPATSEYLDQHSFSSEKMHEPIVSQSDEKLAFVFQVVRHGARAPVANMRVWEFPDTVSEGILTPEGMRQRYLLGRLHRERYVEDTGFLSAEYIPEEIYMQSTNVNRTIQSGYSELMGLYPPQEGGAEKLTRAQVESFDTGRGIPPFNIRGGSAINHELGQNALPNDFTAVAITEYNNYDIRDDTGAYGCQYLTDMDNVRYNDPAVWAQFDDERQSITEPVEKSLDLPDAAVEDITWTSFQSLTDTDVARDFQNTFEHEDYFTDDEWFTLNNFNRYLLAWIYDSNGNALMMTRMLRKPIQLMQNKVNSALGQTITDPVQSDQYTEDLKYMIYSAHDTQITAMMVFLTQSKDSFDWTPYASHVIFELKYSESCLHSSPTSDCFGVSMQFDGTALSFDQCSGDGFTSDGSGCKWTEFQQLMQDIQYSGEYADDLDQACTLSYP